MLRPGMMENKQGTYNSPRELNTPETADKLTTSSSVLGNETKVVWSSTGSSGQKQSALHRRKTHTKYYKISRELTFHNITSTMWRIVYTTACCTLSFKNGRMFSGDCGWWLSHPMAAIPWPSGLLRFMGSHSRMPRDNFAHLGIGVNVCMGQVSLVHPWPILPLKILK